MTENILHRVSHFVAQKVVSCGSHLKEWKFTFFRAIMIVLFLPVISNAQQKYYSAYPLFPMEECVEDLVFYRNKLEREHPNLYLYTSKKEFIDYFDSIVTSIETPLNSLNFFNLIALVASKVKDGHTHIFPADYNEKAPNQIDLLFPFQVHWEGNRMFVTRVYASTTTIPAGTEITRINGVGVSLIYDIIMRRLNRDGFNETYPRWIMDRWFPQYYSSHIERPEFFSLDVKYPGAEMWDSLTIKALPPDSIDYYRQMKYKEPVGETLINTGITLSMDTMQDVALLTIKDFRDETLNQKYGQHFDTVVAEYFTQILKHKMDHLILDLRDNPGGEAQNGILLLSYLLDHSFQFLLSYYEVDEIVNHIPEARLTPTKGPWLGNIEPLEHRFTGKVYVLINGGSFSSTVMICSALRSQNRCTFIGEETGGNPHLVSGGGDYTILPNTKLKILIPNLQYVIRDRDKNVGHGLMPEYPVHPSLPDILAGKDPMLGFAYSLIKK